MNIDFKLLKKQKQDLILISNQASKNELMNGGGKLTKKQLDSIDGIIGLLDAIQDEQEDKFPNGLISWVETHHEIVSAIALTPEDAHNKVNDIEATKGTGGLYEFAEALTDKFEQENKGVEWGIDDDTQYFDAIAEFLETEFDNS